MSSFIFMTVAGIMRIEQRERKEKGHGLRFSLSEKKEKKKNKPLLVAILTLFSCHFPGPSEGLCEVGKTAR